MTRKSRSVGFLCLIIAVVALTAAECGDGRPLKVTSMEIIPGAPRSVDDRSHSHTSGHADAPFVLDAGVAGALRFTVESLGDYAGVVCQLELAGVHDVTLTMQRAPVNNNQGGGVPGVFVGEVTIPALAPGQTASGILDCEENDRSPGNGSGVFEVKTVGSSTDTPGDTASDAGGTVVSANQFSLGLAPEVTGSPGVPAGYIRLWDMATAWKDVNPAPGVFEWSVLDQRVAQVEAAGAKVLYVAGLTPAWAASRSDCDVRWGASSCSAPADPATYSAYITALLQRYGGRISAIEVWNEANLETFWKGTAAEMADLTQRASQAVVARGSGTKVLAASTTTRLAGSLKNVFGPYAAALKTLGYPFDAWSIHTYPAAPTSPVARYAGITAWKAQLATSTGNDPTALGKAVWDTEINYGLAGPGASNPDTDYNPPTAGAYVARTFVDSIRAGISATFWYLWTAGSYGLVGVQMHTGTSSSIDAYNTVRGWTVGATFTGCAEQSGPGVVRCFFTKPGGNPFFIAMSTTDTVEAFSAGAALPAVTWEGTPLNPAGTVSLGIGPVKFTCVDGTNKNLCKVGAN